MKRASGILLPVFSLPSEYGIGDFGKSAYSFVDKLKASAQSYWQILPLGQTGFGDSPYQSFSSFAGNPYFVSPEMLCDRGCLKKSELADYAISPSNSKIDYSVLHSTRYKLLRTAFSRFEKNADYEDFCDENLYWLNDYALFMSLKDAFGGIPVSMWQREIRLRYPEAVKSAKEQLSESVDFYKFIQYEFFSQWKSLCGYAHKNGIEIIGDIPIYVASDSADVWSHPSLFELDDDLRPVNVAGCPPDSFSKDGQLWGNPLYNWQEHKRSGFRWWIKRLERCFNLYDIVRIDHFRGFDEYYSIPANSKNARQGSWRKAPGIALFRTVESFLGEKRIIAEDLGFVTDSVRKLVAECGFPNMKILQFAFDSRDDSSSEHIPHKYQKNCVCYTGTHDNHTLLSWYDDITKKERRAVREYLCDGFTPDEKLPLTLVALAMRSIADTCIIPMQDWLCLSDDARINTPSTLGDNWRWRMGENDFSDGLCKRIKTLTKLCGR